MTDKELFVQLKILRDIRPDKAWADFTRTRLLGYNNSNINIINILDMLERIFGFAVPKSLAISAMAVVVAAVGGLNVYNAGIVDLEIGNSPALTASLRHVTDETASEVAEIQELARIETRGGKGNGLKETKGINSPDSNAPTVIFNKDAEERENFQAILRERIQIKIGYVKDLFAQVEDGDAVREIMQNQRRYEENFKIFGEGLDDQVKDLLADAEQALLEGDLITALDLVNAIEKLIKN